MNKELGWRCLCRRLRVGMAALSIGLLAGVAQGQAPNDSCANAIAIGVGLSGTGTTNGTTVGATNDGLPVDCSVSCPDVWYSYTPCGGGSVTVDLCAEASYDTVLAAYVSCGGAELACNDDFCSLRSSITFNVSSGSNYLIRVTGFGCATGTFTLTLSGPPSGGGPDSDGDGVPDGCDRCPGFPDTADADGDGAPDECDNCPNDSNADQADCDNDGIGDACEPDNDNDGDGVPNDCDNCPIVPNPNQADCNNDGTGDACEPDNDNDGDGVPNDCDNCRNVSNPNQSDIDHDGRGDACDPDIDGDGVLNGVDNCPNIPNPGQEDSDGDGIGDACQSLKLNFQFNGRGNWSLDAVGGNSTPVGDIQAVVPPGSTIVKAFLYSTRSVRNAPSVVFDGTTYRPAAWTPLGVNAFLQAFRVDVTAQVAAKIGSGSSSPFTFTVNSESATIDTDGGALAIIYSNATEQERTIAFLDGFSASGGDTTTFTFAEPLGDPAAPGFEALMSLGIGFGFQTTTTGDQFSLVDVNARRLTSAAGGSDDGVPDNGGLITVGGIGDSRTNPSNPFALPTGTRSDDELYNLALGNGAEPAPFLAEGDTNFVVHTENPSLDDNIFFLGLNVTARGTVVAVQCEVLFFTNDVQVIGNACGTTAPLGIPLGSTAEIRVVIKAPAGNSEALTNCTISVSPFADVHVPGLLAPGEASTNSVGELECTAPGTTLITSQVSCQRVRSLTDVTTSCSQTLECCSSEEAPTVRIIAADPRSGETGPSSARFRVCRNGPTNDLLRVHYSIGGTASNGVDYVALRGRVTILPGRPCERIRVTPIDDAEDEPLETMTLTLLPDPAYTVGVQSNATVNIRDND